MNKGENKETVRSQCHANNTGFHKIIQNLKEQKQIAGCPTEGVLVCPVSLLPLGRPSRLVVS